MQGSRDELQRIADADPAEVAAAKAMSDYAGAVQRRDSQVTVELSRLWADNAELRDELHAVANRVESLTRAVTTDPAEVAAGIVNDANRSTLREVSDDCPYCGEPKAKHTYASRTSCVIA